MDKYQEIIRELTKENYEIPEKGVIGLIQPTPINFPQASDRILASQNNVIIKLLILKIKEKPSNKINEESLSKMFEKLKIDEKPKIRQPKNRKIWYLKEKDPKDLAQ